jgi:hypothetical protein
LRLRRRSCQGVVCVSLAQSLSTCMGAKVVWYVVSGHAVNPSMGARAPQDVLERVPAVTTHPGAPPEFKTKNCCDKVREP